MTVKLFCGDCLELMPKMADKSVDLIATDCPYKIVSGGCCTKNFDCKGVLSQHNPHVKSGKLFGENEIAFSDWLPEAFRVLKDSSHCYVMVNGRNLKNLQVSAEQAGFAYQNLLIWDKGNKTPNRYYMQQVEFILMLKKGASKTINKPGTGNLLSFKNAVGHKRHPTEKPVELMKVLIENSSNAGDIILDPFMGSGSTAIAARQLGRSFIGIDKDEKYFSIAKERIAKHSNESATKSLF